jgi:short subunit dehydrogenase-like uncharacterized protein
MTILIYGASGYTGRLCAAEARARGIDAILAGRNRTRLAEVARPLGLEAAVSDLADGDRLAKIVGRAKAVLHVAGPFSATAAPMVEACLKAGVHYCDITGEIRVLERLRDLGGVARDRGIMLLPGSGFDVVPSDCLLSHVAARVTDLQELSIAIDWRGGASRGTLLTGLGMMGGGVLVRRNGALTSPPEPIVNDFDFGDGPQRCVATTWGDIATAYASTGAPNITTYFTVRSGAGRLAQLPPVLRRAGASRFSRALLRRAARLLPDGPSERELETRTARLVASATGGGGARASTLLTVPHPYALTARVAVDIALRAAKGEAKPGYQTPSTAFGPDYIVGFEGTRRTDRD